MAKPPIKKPITATKEGICKFDKPLIAWPEVQPPAYLDPKPTNKPPINNTNMPLKEVANSSPKI